jgi:hypothetical protein
MHVWCKLSSIKSHGWCAVKIATHIGTRNKAKEHILPVHTQHTPPTPPNKTETSVVRKNPIVGMAQRTHYIAPRASIELDPNVSTSTILDIKKICSTLHTWHWGFWICCYNCGRGKIKPSQNHTTYDSNNQQCCSFWSSHVGLGGNIFMSL